MESGLEDISLGELIDQYIKARLVDVHVSLPCIVESFDAEKQTVEVTPAVHRVLPDGSGNYVSEALPKLSDIPVAFQRCKKFMMTFPLEKGDSGLLVFSEASIQVWRATAKVSAPGDIGRFPLDGAIFIPGVYADKEAAANADASDMLIGSDTDANGRIRCKAAEIQLGDGASKGVNREGDTVDLGTLNYVFSPGSGGASLTITHIPPGGPPAPPGGTDVAMSSGGKTKAGSSKIKAVD